MKVSASGSTPPACASVPYDAYKRSSVITEQAPARDGRAVVRSVDSPCRVVLMVLHTLGRLASRSAVVPVSIASTVLAVRLCTTVAQRPRIEATVVLTSLTPRLPTFTPAHHGIYLLSE